MKIPATVADLEWLEGEGELLNVRKAVVRSGVVYANGEAAAPAPCGEYELAADLGAVRLSSVALAREFTLSIDAFCRLVAEGRISMVAE
ncbi:MAG: hypothetical protein ABL957_12255 [Parvularculaceae bacterium]